MDNPIAPISALETSWYCARTQPKHEHIAAGNVARRLGLEVFHPRLQIERSTRRGMVKVVEPLFPCYIFVRCNLARDLDTLRYLSGISSLVHFGTQTPIVPDPVIEDLRRCFEDDEPVVVENRLKPGTEVAIAAGAFLGLRGVVVRTLPSRQRVQVLLEFLGRTTLTEVDRSSLTVEGTHVPQMVPALAADGGMDITAVA